jgi:NADPH-dependent glutamate synthase beta subunit-like oxidoreductase
LSEGGNRSVAIVGSGPGGMYAAQALIEKAPGTRIDIIDKLPTPFGLIRGGVAPDHQSTKRVDKKYTETAAHEHVRFIGNVEVGKDVSVAELEEIYDAVVLAYGAPYDNKLGIPGEDKEGVFGSNAFVGWYNCHPEFRDLAPDLGVEGAVVIGVGNVAVDVARVLSRTPDEMAVTDVADYAMSDIHDAPLKDVWMFGRRGPMEASFTNNELKELGELEAATCVVEAAQLPDAVPDSFDDREQKVKQRILDTLHKLCVAKVGAKRRTIHLQFYAMPVEILGGDRVEGIRMERTRVEDGGRCVGTGETFDIPCGLVVTCIGSRAHPIEGIPFDDRRGIVVSDEGRVKDRVYAVGWLKRGAVGTIGTNRLDSYGVVDLLLEDVSAGGRAGQDGIDALVKERGIHATSFEDWLRLDELEQEAAHGAAPRRKFTAVKEMLDALGRG